MIKFTTITGLATVPKYTYLSLILSAIRNNRIFFNRVRIKCFMNLNTHTHFNSLAMVQPKLRNILRFVN